MISCNFPWRWRELRESSLKTIDFFGPRYGLPNAISAHQKLLFLGAAHQYARIRIQLQLDASGRFESNSATDGRLPPVHTIPSEESSHESFCPCPVGLGFNASQCPKSQ